VGASGERWLSGLADHRLTRRLLGSLFEARCRLHLALLDRPAPARAQLRILRGLLHQARTTAFGRDHDFRRIRTAGDFRRLVPLRTPTQLWREYGPATFPGGGVTWPGILPHRITPHNRDGRPGEQPLPLSPALQAAHRAALRTALALVVQARPQARLLDGTILWLGEDSTLTLGALSTRRAPDLGRERFPWAVRPYTSAGLGWDCPAGAGAVPTLAGRHADADLTCLIGPGERVAAFLDEVSRLHAGAPLCRIYPRLAAVIYTPRGPEVAGTLRDLLGDGPLLMQAALRPEAPLAVEDPRLGALRLLCEHGCYLEFVVPGSDDPHAQRRGLDEVCPGEPYEVALTSPAGLWACRTGTVVAFDRTEPPLVRLLPPVPIRADAPAPPLRHPPQDQARGPHRPTAGIPAARPERLVRSPWSAPADRG
jgi:hypothetical protein